MPAIKIIDKDPKSQRRRPQLWETFGEVGINPNDIKDGKGVYYAIVRQEQVELVISEEVKETFKDKGYDVMIPIEYDSMRSVVIRHIDKVINEYTDQEVTESINNANEWAEVEQLHRILTNDRLLKVKFKSAAMVQNPLTQGIIVLHTKINPKNIEKRYLFGLLHVITALGIVTQPLYESRVNWIHDPAAPASRRPAMEAAPTPASAILEAPSTQPKHQKSWRRRRRKAARPANQKAASRPADPMTPDERWTNGSSASRRATRPRSVANDLPEMRSTPVEHLHSFHSSCLPQPPIPATNQNSVTSSRLDHPGFSGLYKPAQADSRQDSTATHSRVTNSGFGLSSPALQQPSTKPFSGLPSRHLMTSPHREAGEAE